MSTTEGAPAAEGQRKESAHTKAKKEKSEPHRSHDRKHGHSKKSKRGEASSAATPLSSATAAAAAAASNDEEDWDENRAAVERLCAQYPNNICCDCGESGTRWASVNHGVFVCIRCSGVHRSLGAHVSKVKSTNMDRWSLAEVRLMEAIGNTKGKTLYEARLPSGTRPALGGGSVADDALKSFIRRKYVDREFAMHNVKDVLRRLYRDTGYGRPPKKPSKIGEATASASSAREAPPLDRAAITGKRGDTMRALYGEAAEEMQRRASKRKKGGAEGSSLDAAAPQPTFGAFGLVNVPADAYDERWRRTLEVFNHVEAVAVAEEAVREEEEQEGGDSPEEKSDPSSPPAAATATAEDGATEASSGDVVAAGLS
ncbi:hypothetical protein ABB37_04589 [Leptomonas pyrrhocoris]|uniref:Arf-GAP domain-containing protein n=1 Tax=Leptomonas pyrrhocoris TaxID=157538 RepID=A0A0M9G1G4_LEPPY|nr:hypothetical protein ABB37_04589 [Leptomonas pyrrhocoris]XP_015658743.1 hypothetical protein ABB37_04589 [Leptomonas pyrrhocoris]KPA80303.1 hypothetical protein ABB37_04589 [Leptomonas pyrrhocoris]KPA80304.1 hypothetical protein ABB37_04589 [Leptomonas pyrrhocoris]|eukprot:XP_015658742.1 hypothetical protein ABB37_04589 [Leptomonas pyrrhocoris]